MLLVPPPLLRSAAASILALAAQVASTQVCIDHFLFKAKNGFVHYLKGQQTCLCFILLDPSTKSLFF